MNSLTPTVYDGGKKGKYEETDPVNGQTAYGKKSLTTLRIAQRYGKKIGESQKTQFHAFGITGDTACVYMNLTPSLNSDWSIIDDEWGKKDKQIDKGNGWYTVQIPMDKTIINQSANRPDVSPTETFGYLYFSSGGVNCSFLVDNFKIESAKGNDDLNGDGKTDKTDVDIFMAYLARNAAPPQNVWEADLDHNGVHDARDMSRLKQMLLA